MGQTAVIPAWVAPATREVMDCHWIAHAIGDRAEFAAVAAVLDWATSTDPSIDDAHAQMDACAPTPAGEAARNTLAWLIGFQSIPPIRLPRRNPDGTVVTADQLCAEYTARTAGLPEELRAARHRAEQDAALYRRLAALIPGH
jgi:hypothetical protein